MIIRGNTITIHQESLPIVGGTMKGEVNMDGNVQSGIPDPTENDHAVNKKYADTIKTEAATSIKKVSDDASTAVKTAEKNAKDYTDSKHLNPKVTLTAGGWVGESAPYTQTVAVENILSTDEPHFAVMYSGDQATKQAQKEAFALVDDLDTADGSVTFTCFEEKPEIELLIQMEVNR